MTKLPKWLIFSLMITSFIGFIDSTYLTVVDFKGLNLNCNIISGCNDVLSSSYSKIFNIPMALLGALYYVTIFLLSIFYFDTGKKIILKIIPIITTIGFLFSIYLTYLQGFVIKSFCQYCLLSAITSTILFALSIFVIRYKKRIS